MPEINIHEPAPHHRHARAARHGAVGQRQQGRAAAQHARARHPERDARRHAVPGGRRARHHRAPAARRAPHPRARCVRPGRAAEAVAAGRIQHRRQPAAQPDGFRARDGREGQAAAPGHLRAGQRRPVHLRPRLAVPAGRAAPAPADRRSPRARRAREPVHGPAARSHACGARRPGADRVELYTESYARAHGTPERGEVLAAFTATARAALQEGLASTPATT